MSQINRRDFLMKSLGAVTVVGLAATGSSFLTSCGGGDNASSGGGAADCSDISNLTADEKKVRDNFKYVDKTADAAKHCANCQFHIPPASANDCGGCQLFKGPVKDEGYCISWAPKA